MTQIPVGPHGAGGRLGEFDAYAPDLESACLRLFDANCPAFFAPNERPAYAAFLERLAPGYFVKREIGEVVAAFGLSDEGLPARRRLTWIMVHPDRQGEGLGRRVMAAVSDLARAGGATTVDIAASHLSAPFFARSGAKTLSSTLNGWGPDMHRVDMEWPLATPD